MLSDKLIYIRVGENGEMFWKCCLSYRWGLYQVHCALSSSFWLAAVGFADTRAGSDGFGGWGRVLGFVVLLLSFILSACLVFSPLWQTREMSNEVCRAAFCQQHWKQSRLRAFWLTAVLKWSGWKTHRLVLCSEHPTSLNGFLLEAKRSSLTLMYDALSGFHIMA